MDGQKSGCHVASFEKVITPFKWTNVETKCGLQYIIYYYIYRW